MVSVGWASMLKDNGGLVDLTMSRMDPLTAEEDDLEVVDEDGSEGIVLVGGGRIVIWNGLILLGRSSKAG